MNVLEELNLLEEEKSRGNSHPLYMRDKTYHLCMEERMLSVAISLWLDKEKPCPLSVRNATKGVDGCVVISVKDVGGQHIDFITLLVGQCKARVVAR